jgi:hypothetical protein
MHYFHAFSSPDLDQYFDLRIVAIENTLLKAARDLRPSGNLDNLSHVYHDGHQTWIGLDPQTLNTPYSELVQICRMIGEDETGHVVDLGAGYGRLGIVLADLCPHMTFTGYEIVKERVEEGNRVYEKLQMHQAKLYHADLTSTDFILPEASVYFIYDYGKVAHIRQTLKQLEKLADRKHFKVVARGQGTRSLIDFEHQWLSQIKPVLREENFAIYSY